MLITLICTLLLMGIFAAAFYMAYKAVEMKQSKQAVERDLEAAKQLINDMDERIQQLEFERDQGMREAEMKGTPTGKQSGWSVFEGRG